MIRFWYIYSRLNVSSLIIALTHSIVAVFVRYSFYRLFLLLYWLGCKLDGVNFAKATFTRYYYISLTQHTSPIKYTYNIIHVFDHFCEPNRKKLYYVRNTIKKKNGLIREKGTIQSAVRFCPKEIWIPMSSRKFVIINKLTIQRLSGHECMTGWFIIHFRLHRVLELKIWGIVTVWPPA